MTHEGQFTGVEWLPDTWLVTATMVLGGKPAPPVRQHIRHAHRLSPQRTAQHATFGLAGPALPQAAARKISRKNFGHQRGLIITGEHWRGLMATKRDAAARFNNLVTFAGAPKIDQ